MPPVLYADNSAPTFATAPADATPRAAHTVECAADPAERVRVVGKFLRVGSRPWYLKGVSYGPFARNSAGYFLPEREQERRDFDQLRELGCNAIRLYHPPPPHLLDDALERGLRVLIDVPWEKHRCFLEDWAAQRDARHAVVQTAKELGGHPATMAISVANEIPHDVVRFYRPRRIERFLDDLLDAAKQEAPECLVTYCNYPSTEFLSPTRLDFLCTNLYLHDPQSLSAYLQRLQHIAGPLPLILGEHGMDSIRHTPQRQAAALGEQLDRVFKCGLAGSFVFSFTDDWFTGGHRITDWAFGLTDAARRPKAAAAAVREAWSRVEAAGSQALPRASVVVCSYNGANTLEECLRSLDRLEYPDYEVILVDDGSTDRTPEIATRFPRIRYLRQANLGLSAARNAGARAATGEIVAYTDSDCVAEPNWLLHLVTAMRDQAVDAIGGPNVPPGSDSWVAKCVAASPGGPSHVMLDDHLAEHVPGCNMAFRRDRLLALGGFDVQFRQAGDDVDICWRYLDAGLRIGYAPAALVWHHRRSTVKAYLRQQSGYGRSEAMLHFKHPRRFNEMGCSIWRGVIYGEGAVGIARKPHATYHGRFGASPFQIVYRQNVYSLWSLFTLPEWHALALFFALLALLAPPIAAVAGLMWCLTLVAALRSTAQADLPPGAPRWCRPLVFVLHLAQPVVRGWQRHVYRVRHRRLPRLRMGRDELRSLTKRISPGVYDMYWSSDTGPGREQLLEAAVLRARAAGWAGDFDAEWAPHDLELVGDRWHDMHVYTATEELGAGKRFTRARCELRRSRVAGMIAATTVAWTAAAVLSRSWWALALPPAVFLWLAIVLTRSRARCRAAVARLFSRAGKAAGLDPVLVSASRSRRPAPEFLGDAAEPNFDVCVR